MLLSIERLEKAVLIKVADKTYVDSSILRSYPFSDDLPASLSSLFDNPFDGYYDDLL